MRVIVIVAMTEDRLIGRGGRLPWHEPDDLAHFKRTTVGHAVIMGRKTHESIGRALPGRRNIILTRQADYAGAAGVRIVRSLEEALAICRAAQEEKAFIIGGATVYAEALPLADELIVTEIPAEGAAGDAYFPAFDSARWRASERTQAGRLLVRHYERQR